jgi:hypothetical protein
VASEVAQACDSSTWNHDQEDHEFEASLGSIMRLSQKRRRRKRKKRRGRRRSIRRRRTYKHLSRLGAGRSSGENAIRKFNRKVTLALLGL